MIAAEKLTRRVDRIANRGLERAYPTLLRGWRALAALLATARAWLGPRLRPVGALFFRGVAASERGVRRACSAAVAVTTAGQRPPDPPAGGRRRVIAAAACLVISEFVAYRGVEIGQPGYAGLTEAAPPTSGAAKTAGEAQAYLLVPLALLAALVGGLRPRDRRRLGRGVAALGLVGLAAILLVDLPVGLDAGTL